MRRSLVNTSLRGAACAVAVLALFGCRSSSPSSPSQGNVEAKAASKLVLGAGKLTFWSKGSKEVEVALDADGSVTLTPVDPSTKAETAKLTASGELDVDGKPHVKLGNDDSLSIAQHDGTWAAIGKLDSHGTFTRSDGRVTVAIVDGKVTGLLDRIDVAPGTPARAAILVVIALSIGSDEATDALLTGDRSR